MPIVNSFQECSEQAASWTSGDSIALAALTVALITAGIAYRAYRASIDQLKQNQRHNELSVRPILEFDVDIWKPDQGGIWLINSGSGAALLKRLRANLDGTEYDLFNPVAQRQFSTKVPDATNFKAPANFEFETAESHRVAGSSIPPGSRSPLMVIVKDETGNFRASFHAAKGLKLSVDYQDLYGNDFSSSFDIGDYAEISADEALAYFKSASSAGKPVAKS